MVRVGVGLLSVLVVVALLGCEDDSVTYRVAVHRQDSVSARPAPVVPAAVYIDGVLSASHERVYESTEAYLAAEVVVELRHGDLVLDTLIAGGRTCGVTGPIESVFESVAAFDHGELGLWSLGVEGADPCIADLYEGPTCGACGAGEHCTSVMTSLDPPFSKLACAPAGGRLLGEACAWQAGPDGYVHDCAADLLCVDATCHAVCTEAVCPGCVFAEGHASQLRVCP